MNVPSCGKLMWEKRDVHVGNKWDSSWLWANMQGHSNVFTGLLYYLECIYVSMMHGRNNWCGLSFLATTISVAKILTKECGS